MSGAYPLQAPRARRPPPKSLPYLYDLPSPPASPSPRPNLPLSPSTSPHFNANIATRTAISTPPTSPTSPTLASRTRGRRIGRPGPTSPRSSSGAPRNRSVTPLGVSRADLEKFAEHCRAWYFDQHEESGRQMGQTLTILPPAQRAPYARLQASVRSAYHASVRARRAAEFQAHLAATQPGGSLLPHARAHPTGPTARRERRERFLRFVGTWCILGMPGTRPFFEALWAVMRLQVLPENLGGAGAWRVRWELDDAVFKEAAGKNFMLDAINVLKGALGFEDLPRPASSTGYPSHLPLSSALSHSRCQSQPLPVANDARIPTHPPTHAGTHEGGHGPEAIAVAVTQHATLRARAPSDPFLDMPALSYSASSRSSGATVPPGVCAAGGDDREGAEGELARPWNKPARAQPQPELEPDQGQDQEECTALPPLPSGFELRRGVGVGHGLGAAGEEPDGEMYLRVWTAPDLSNTEYLSLLSLFPAFITRRTVPRFTLQLPRGGRLRDVEEGDTDTQDGEGEREERGEEIKFGTGTIWVSGVRRGEGYKGYWWTRLMHWWRRLFSFC